MTSKQFKEEKALVKRRSLGAATLVKWGLGGVIVIGLVLLALVAVFYAQ